MVDLFLKKIARDKLGGIYFNTVLGQLICYIPAYLLASLATLLSLKTNNPAITLIISLIGEIFILDMFTVGYIRSLIDANDRTEADEKRYDINIVLSGFSKNYAVTLKTMFLRRLYLFGWGCLMLLPMIIAVGVIAFLSDRPEVSRLINYVMQLIQSPTSDMFVNINEYIAQNCAYVMYILGGASLVSIILFIPYIRKSYLYEMIPMIIAETPDISSTEAFEKTKRIMNGYRMKFFALELSFIGIMILVSVITYAIPTTVITYIINAAAMPYITMTFIQFYLSRTRAVTEEAEENKDI